MSHVLCLGEVLIDQIAEQVAVPRSDVQSWRMCVGGALANVACGLAKLGTPVYLISCVGQDRLGKHCVEFLVGQGVRTTAVQVHPHAVTREVYITRDAKGNRVFAGFTEQPRTAFADTVMDARFLPEDLFAEADFLVLGSLGLASEQTSRAVGRALKLAEKYFVPVVVDLNWRPMFWPQPALAAPLIRLLLQHADFLKVSAIEAIEVLRCSSPGALRQMFDHLEGIIVTDDERECRYLLGDRQSRIPAFAVEAVDTTGAGDAFLAALIHRLRQRPLAELTDVTYAYEVVRYACAAGALTTMGIGAIAPQPNHGAIETFLAARTEQQKSEISEL